MPSYNPARNGSTRASRQLRANTLRDWPTCYLQYPGCTQTSTEDDHVIPIAEGGSDLDPDNHRGACHHCHTIKSKAEAARGRQRRSIKRDPEPHPGLVTRHNPRG